MRILTMLEALSTRTFGFRRKPHLVAWLMSAIAATGSLLTAGARSAVAQPLAQQRVNFREPAREYALVRMGDLKVSVEKQLRDQAPEIARKALERLQAQRLRALAALPPDASKRLARIPFFLMFGPRAKGGGKTNGLEYFQKDAPRFHPELDGRWQDAIVIYSAQNYIRISDLWAQKSLMHELGHAYQLEQWPEHQSDIQQAWEHARDSGLYRNVRDVETGKTISSAYALTNQLEYFAELTCMYFAKCNYAPSDRQELERYDSVGFAMIRKMWKVTR